ncbi:hypothetical protein, partial [Treponema sp. R8-4-B8]
GNYDFFHTGFIMRVLRHFAKGGLPGFFVPFIYFIFAYNFRQKSMAFYFVVVLKHVWRYAVV